MRNFECIDEFKEALGEEFGPSEWLEITQQRIDQFAQATEDRQWIHVDPARAKTGPFGSTVAHGILTLSLLPYFTEQLFGIRRLQMAINYGYDKVRFIAPVPVDARLRARARLSRVKEVNGGVQVSLTMTIEVEKAEKPALVAESIVRLLG